MNGNTFKSRYNNGSQVMSYYGPGLWYSLHISSISANTESDQYSLIEHIYTIFSSLPCSKCRGHALEYYNNNKPENYVMKNMQDGKFKIKKSLSLFYYLWEMHNTVNKRLGKRKWSFREAYDFYKIKITSKELSDTPYNRNKIIPNQSSDTPGSRVNDNSDRYHNSKVTIKYPPRRTRPTITM